MACFQTHQSLPSASPENGAYVTGEYTGSEVQNVYHDPAAHSRFTYSKNQGSFRPGMMCSSGAVTIDNECACPSTKSGSPFLSAPKQYTSGFHSALFSPMQPAMFPQISSAAATLIKQRSPLPAGQCAFSVMDTTPLTRI